MISINRVVSFLILALIVYYIVTDPSSAAGVVRNIAYTLREAAESITVFFRQIV